MKLKNLLKGVQSKTAKIGMGLGTFVAGTASAMATGDTTTTLSTMTTNVNHLVGDGLQMVSIAGVGIAIVFGFVAFNHLRQHASDQGGQGKHMHKFFMHSLVALGFLSVPAILHMVQNTALKGTNVQQWSVPTDGNITPENGG